MTSSNSRLEIDSMDWDSSRAPASKSISAAREEKTVEFDATLMTGAMGLPVGVPRPVLNRTS